MTQPHFWQKKSFPALALWPLACIYSLVSKAHLALRGLCPYRASVPVMSVGNINVGGVGKTPIVQALAGILAGQGHHVAILSRGYGGEYAKIHPRPHKVTAEDTAQEVGDEPAMLFEIFKHQSVDIWVSKNRVASAKRAAIAGATVILLDDGFQYKQLSRDLNLAILDGTQEGKYHLGNGFTLPAGPLRESAHTLNRADALIVLNATDEPKLSTSATGRPTLHLTTCLNPEDIQNLCTLSQNKKNTFFAFAGIGKPEKFFNQLRSAGIPLDVSLCLPDHHKYPSNPLQYLLIAAKSCVKSLKSPQSLTPIFVTTSKDAIKFPKAERRKLTTVRLQLQKEDIAKLTHLVHNTLNSFKYDNKNK